MPFGEGGNHPIYFGKKFSSATFLGFLNRHLSDSWMVGMMEAGHECERIGLE